MCLEHCANASATLSLSFGSLTLFVFVPYIRVLYFFQFIHMNVRPPASPSTLSEDPDDTHFTSLYQELHASSPPRRRQQSNATSQRRSGNTVNRGPSKSPKLPSIHRKSQTRSPHAGLSHWGPGSHKSTTKQARQFHSTSVFRATDPSGRPNTVPKAKQTSSGGPAARKLSKSSSKKSNPYARRGTRRSPAKKRGAPGHSEKPGHGVPPWDHSRLEHGAQLEESWRRSMASTKVPTLPRAAALSDSSAARASAAVLLSQTQEDVQCLQKSFNTHARKRDRLAKGVASALEEAERIVPLHFLKQYASIGEQKQKVIQLVQDAVHTYTIGNMTEAFRRWVVFLKADRRREKDAAATMVCVIEICFDRCSLDRQGLCCVAAQIEKIYVGHLARKKFADIWKKRQQFLKEEAARQLKLAEKRKKRQDKAAAQIQRIARGVLARKRVAHLNYLRNAARVCCGFVEWLGLLVFCLAVLNGEFVMPRPFSAFGRRTLCGY